MPKGRKICLTISSFSFVVLLVFFLFKVTVHTLTQNWYFLTFVHPSDIDTTTYAKTHHLKVVEITDDYLLIKIKDQRVFYRNEDIEEVCEFMFHESYSAKTALSYNLHDQRCNPLRRSYMEHHPILTVLMQNKGR